MAVAASSLLGTIDRWTTITQCVCNPRAVVLLFDETPEEGITPEFDVTRVCYHLLLLSWCGGGDYTIYYHCIIR